MSVGMIIIAICNCQPRSMSVINLETRAPITIPPGNQTWNLLSIVVRFLVYISAISGLQAASTEPLANPMKKVDINNGQKPDANMVNTRPTRCETNAMAIRFFGPKVLYRNPPSMVATGNPQKAILFTKPSCVSVRPKLVPNWLRIPALIANVIAVTRSAMQLATNSGVRLICCMK